MVKKVFDVIAKIASVFSAVLLAIMVVVYFSEFVVRYFFNSGLTWAEELTTYAMIWSSYIVLTANNWGRGGHICVSIVEDMWPKATRILYPIQQLIIAAFGGFITGYGLKAAMYCLQLNQLTPNLRIPMGIVYLAMPIGCALTCLISLYQLVTYFTEKQWRAESEVAEK